eukprot:EG_transcript_29558
MTLRPARRVAPPRALPRIFLPAQALPADAEAVSAIGRLPVARNATGAAPPPPLAAPAPRAPWGPQLTREELLALGSATQIAAIGFLVAYSLVQLLQAGLSPSTAPKL